MAGGRSSHCSAGPGPCRGVEDAQVQNGSQALGPGNGEQFGTDFSTQVRGRPKKYWRLMLPACRKSLVSRKGLTGPGAGSCAHPGTKQLCTAHSVPSPNAFIWEESTIPSFLEQQHFPPSDTDL